MADVTGTRVLLLGWHGFRIVGVTVVADVVRFVDDPDPDPAPPTVAATSVRPTERSPRDYRAGSYDYRSALPVRRLGVSRRSSTTPRVAPQRPTAKPRRACGRLGTVPAVEVRAPTIDGISEVLVVEDDAGEALLAVEFIREQSNDSVSTTQASSLREALELLTPRRRACCSISTCQTPTE